MNNLFLQGERREVTDEPVVGLVVLDETTIVLTQSGRLSHPQWNCHLQPNGTHWFQMTLIDTYLVCLSREGAIVSVSIHDGLPSLVGEFENGLLAAAWSPDGEILALLTRLDDSATVLLTLNSEWDVLAEVPCACQGEEVSLCWKPDGQRLAISAMDDDDSQRKIRIYARATLQVEAIGRTEDGSGKLVPNLQHVQMGWAGPGCSQLLASVQTKSRNKPPMIAFFESNGLRHREFVLRDKGITAVLMLEWNVESNLLAVAYRTTEGDRVQLWHRSNYHWYLKREIRFTESIVSIQFHAEDSNLLHVLTERGWREYRLRWDRSTVRTTTKRSTALVVDGTELKVTHLEQAVIPPPMSAASVQVDAPIVDIATCPENIIGAVCFLLLADGSGALVLEDDEKRSLVATPIAFPEEISVLSLREATVSALVDSSIELVVASSMESSDSLHTFMVLVSGESKLSAVHESSISIPGTVLTMSPWLDCVPGVLIQMTDGVLYTYHRATSSELVPYVEASFVEPCPWVQAINGIRSTTPQPSFAVGLSPRGQLWCNEIQIADAVSCFHISLPHGYVCFVTGGSRQEFRSVAFASLADYDPLSGSEDLAALSNFEPRAVERGATIVSILPTKPSAIMQLPRGNLEIISPRSLVLRFVMHQIKESEYACAFATMRRQKVDLNLIVDLDPVHFLYGEGLTEFLKQVQHIDFLNLFVATLQNYDSTVDRFAIPEWLRSECSGSQSPTTSDCFDFADKVNPVCRAVRSALLELEGTGATTGESSDTTDRFLLPILSTFAKEEPPKLEQALSLICERNGLYGKPMPSKPPLFSEYAQGAIQYLAFLAEYELLYDTALGMYDYDLARAVARNSQMDPKVYLPLVRRLKVLPTYFARYAVDLRLKRYESAFRNLVKSCSLQERDVPDESGSSTSDDKFPSFDNSFEKCMGFLEEHQLFRVGLELFTTETDKSRVLQSLGDYLMERQKYAAALSTYMASSSQGDYKQVLHAARMSRNWRVYFDVLQRSETITAPEAMAMTAHEVAHELIADTSSPEKFRTLHLDASTILLDYANDLHGAVDLLLKAQHWDEACRVSQLHGIDNLANKTVDAAVVYSRTTINDLYERLDSFLESQKRYNEVLWIRKAAAPQEGFVDGEDNEQGETGSVFSSASNISAMSLASTGSTSSVGSVSSVISVRTSNSFALTGSDAENRHKSKFNQAGKQKKKKKKKSKGRSRILPGSHAELLSLAQSLRVSVVTQSFVEVIAETISFLLQRGRAADSMDLYQCYNECKAKISASTTDRVQASQRRVLQENVQRQEDGLPPLASFPEIETVIDALSWPTLPPSVEALEHLP